jgi:dolichyl-phosphate beta-glucosyltransferase
MRLDNRRGVGSISVVIPAYNERFRLPDALLALLQARSSDAFAEVQITEILIVDDGSTDDTLAALPEPARASGILRTLRLNRNSGKGAAVRSGLREARGDWVLVADADQATPWNQLLVLLQEQERHQADIVIGSRGLSQSLLVRRQNPIREALGKLFNRLIVGLTGLPFKDTQCGFKLIRRPGILPFLPQLRIDRFAWDVEFLMRAQRAGLHITETPVTWCHQDGSKIRPLRDGLRMVLDFLVLRIRMALKHD